MLNLIQKFLFNATEDTAIMVENVTAENPKLEQMRAEARRRMREDFKRPDLLSGGTFTRRNTVLPAVTR